MSNFLSNIIFIANGKFQRKIKICFENFLNTFFSITKAPMRSKKGVIFDRKI